ncbi:MAG: polysaccharide deacetylase family protein [Flavobacteriales bacterium]|nr:polysaccharide deacetylase family protein [Flavobacteriales bacterium]
MLKLLILSETDHPRFRYAVSMVLSGLEGEIVFTRDQNLFEHHQGPKLYYGSLIKDTWTMPCSQFLWNDSLALPAVRTSEEKGILRIYFGDEQFFDVFAATFLLLSRLEEYQPNVKDEHGRFKATSSLLRDKQRYRYPWVDIWRAECEKQLQGQFPELVFRSREFTIQATIDVDSAFAYKHKGLIRTAGGFVKDVVGFKFGNAVHRFLSIAGVKSDPYKTYLAASVDALEKNISIIWFFLLSDYSKENINVPPNRSALHQLIQDLAVNHQIGIHPGYHHGNVAEELSKEVRRLREITGAAVNKSRQHYLRMSLPETYQMLIHQGITDDYTMGFADDYGYRAATASPYPWFDLTKNVCTSLTLHPFVVMDTTLKNYLRLSPEEAMVVLKQLKEKCRELHVPFEFLWHNESLSEHHSWKGWSKVWKSIFE